MNPEQQTHVTNLKAAAHDIKAAPSVYTNLAADEVYEAAEYLESLTIAAIPPNIKKDLIHETT